MLSIPCEFIQELVAKEDQEQSGANWNLEVIQYTYPRVLFLIIRLVTTKFVENVISNLSKIFCVSAQATSTVHCEILVNIQGFTLIN